MKMRRELSLEALSEQFLSPDDIYDFIKPLDRGTRLINKDPINEADRIQIPGISQIDEAIAALKKQAEKEEDKTRRGSLKIAIMQLYQDQYVLKAAFRQPLYTTPTPSLPPTLLLEDPAVKGDEVTSAGPISLFDAENCSALLLNYSNLKESGLHPSSSIKMLLDELDTFLTQLPADHLLICKCKFSGFTSQQIQSLLKNKLSITYSPERISKLWRHIIPKEIAELAIDDYLDYYYTFVEKGKYKKCKKCGEIKLALPRYFSKNSSSKDGLYSVCRKCRSKQYAERAHNTAQQSMSGATSTPPA